MSDSVLMPALGESVTEGTVTRWLKQVGDQVAVDEPLLEVSTDKVDTEIPSPFAGTLTEILVAEDETVEVGTALATIGDPADAGGQQGGGGQQDQGEQPPATGGPQQPDTDQAEAQQARGQETSAQEPTDGADAGDEQQAAQVPQDVTQGAEQEQEPAEQEPAERRPAQQEQPAQPQVQEHEATTAPQEAVRGGEGGFSGGGATQDVTMPALGESVTEGTVTRWLKQVGDAVAVDEPLLEVSTDKVDTEIPSPFAGTLTEILVAEDDTVAVGTALARIGAAGGAAPSPSSEQAPSAQTTPERAAEPAGQEQQAEQPAQEQAPEQPQQTQPSSEAGASAITAVVPEAPAQQESPVQEAVPPTREPNAAQEQTPAPQPSGAPSAGAPSAGAPSGGAPGGASGYLTPLVRKLAAEKGVDLGSLTGTGVGGRIRKEDVLDAAAKAEQERAERERAEQARTQEAAERAAAPAPTAAAAAPAASVSPLRGTTEKASRLRQIIASRMVESLQSMAQLTTVVEVDVTKVARLRTRAKDGFKAREGLNLTFLPFFVLAATEALKAHPKVNGLLEGNQITYHGEENVGIAVDTERGLVVPVIRGAGDLNLAGIARKIADLAARTRANKVTPDELSGATFTVTNTGSGGALFDTPIVPAGTSAILGTGAIVKRPVVATDEDGAEYIAIRSMCYLALSYDHRLVDGADASRYLAAVKKRIEDGDFEAEVGA